MLEHTLTREEVREIDRRAISEYGISGLVLMENAGRGCADFLCQQGINGPVIVCCGKGNNGGDGFVIARHLDGRGYDVRVLLFFDSADLRGDAAANYQILEATRLPVFRCPQGDPKQWLDEQLGGGDWVVDALLGTGTQGEPRFPLNVALQQINAHPARKLAVDLPSGLDCDTGKCAESTFRADYTCTFVAAKTGFQATEAGRCLGTIHILDIGIPGKLLREFVRV